MKKIFYLLFAALCIVACSEKNTPTNPGGGNPENPGGNPDEPGGNPDEPGGDKTKSPRYISYYESVYTFQDTTGGRQWSGQKVGDVSKAVYERGSDVKFLLSTTSYLNSDLVRKISYQNVGNADYGVYTEYPGSPHLVGAGADTTYWYDEDRTLPSKTINGTLVTTYTYNDKGLVTFQVTYYSGKKISENQYTYSGNVRYGKNTSYDSATGLESSTYRDTLIYEDIDRSMLKQWRMYSHIETDTYISTSRTVYDYTNCSYGVQHLVTDSYSKTYIKANGSESVSRTGSVYDYSYQDDLHISYIMKSYIDGRLLSETSNRYVYVR